MNSVPPQFLSQCIAKEAQLVCALKPTFNGLYESITDHKYLFNNLVWPYLQSQLYESWLVDTISLLCFPPPLETMRRSCNQSDWISTSQMGKKAGEVTNSKRFTFAKLCMSFPYVLIAYSHTSMMCLPLCYSNHKDG